MEVIINMIKLKPEVITYIQQQTPQGITLTKNKKGLYVKMGKMINGQEKTLTKTIRVTIQVIWISILISFSHAIVTHYFSILKLSIKIL